MNSESFLKNPVALESNDAVRSIYDEKTTFPGIQSDQSSPITTLLKHVKTCENLLKHVKTCQIMTWSM